MARIGLVFGGRSVEHQVSIRSARTVAAALAEAGHEVWPLGIADDGCWLGRAPSQGALDGSVDQLPGTGERVAATLERLTTAEIDLVFPLVHGTWGEDGTLQGLCEMADLAYVGAGVAASAVAMDKILCKQVLERNGVPVVDYEAVTRQQFAADRPTQSRRAARLGFPQFVKPSVGGSSVGVSKVTSEDELDGALALALALDERALVERGIDGRELECSVLGYPELEASPVGEVRPGRDFYDYADKYLEDDAELLIPAALDRDVEARLRETAVAAYAAVGGAGMARVDFLLEEGGALYVNEINTLPGFTSISMYPKLWQAGGVSLPDLVNRLVAEGFARHRSRQGMDRQIKEFLAELLEHDSEH